MEPPYYNYMQYVCSALHWFRVRAGLPGETQMFSREVTALAYRHSNNQYVT